MEQAALLDQIRICIERGKTDKNAPYPPDMRGQDGADELTKLAIEQGVKPEVLLNESMVKAMDYVGKLFSEKKIFIPQMLISARAMTAAIKHLKPFFQSGEVQRKGTFIIGTVAGDLHDIGKNLVAMIVEGAGWEVIDLGVDVSAEKFITALKGSPNAVVGISALLTTTMVNMETIIKEIKDVSPNSKVIIGGAPVTDQFSTEIKADGYASDPNGAVKFLNALVA
ncbi:MAG: cobalamin-binding protein [Bacteroidetes bacterium]|nr:cobalamin-binding protein [Bacteroidota bacterium]